jgi:hypothetical protein
MTFEEIYETAKNNQKLRESKIDPMKLRTPVIGNGKKSFSVMV